MEDRLSFADIIDRALERLLDGEPVARILAAYPDRAAELASLLGPADALAAVPVFEAGPAQRAQAMRGMFDQVQAAAAAAGAVGTGGGGLMSIFRSFRGRPLAIQAAAAAGALVLFGALGLGASAATGNGPAPVREFFGISSSSAIRIEFQGTIVSIEPEANTLVVSANGDMRMVLVSDGTEITGNGHALTLDDLSAGQLVEVKGTLQSDNTIAATRLHLEDAGAEPTVPAPGVPTAPAAVPTVDDRDDDGDDDGFEEDDNGADDDDDNGDDNLGPGGGDDDREGGDDGPDDDGPSDDDDGTDDRDDDSGPGGGDDGGDD